MAYRVLADIVVVAHLGFVVFVALGALLAWRWPRLIWWHLPCVAWSAALVTFGLTCPLTPLERDLRERGGEAAYEESFVERYIEGVLYPGDHTTTARALVAVAIGVGWAGLLVRHQWRRRPDDGRPSARPPRERSTADIG
jgi:hypothetical protein